MLVLIRVFKNAILVQVGQGPVITFYDWNMVISIIRDDDTVTVQSWIN